MGGRWRPGGTLASSADLCLRASVPSQRSAGCCCLWTEVGGTITLTWGGAQHREGSREEQNGGPSGESPGVGRDGVRAQGLPPSTLGSTSSRDSRTPPTAASTSPCFPGVPLLPPGNPEILSFVPLSCHLRLWFPDVLSRGRGFGPGSTIDLHLSEPCLYTD